MAKQCPTCEAIYGDSLERCPEDDELLERIDDADDALVGEVIDDRFRLDDLLGAGGMGRVYRGTQLSVERDVAVKLLRGEAVPDRSMQERFFREARVISGFNHPNIVRLIDFGRDTDLELPYLVMELAGGVSLADLVTSGRLHPAFAVEVARQVCSGLLEAHGENIVHRDLKPDNLHLIANSDGSFHVKILDFGIAFPQDSSKNLTATGMMCGTAPYVSPEQARSDDLDGQADLYSLGIIIYEMLSGVRPFQGDSGFEIIMKQVQEPPPNLQQYLPPDAVPSELVALVYELLEKDARQRPSGAGAVRDRLDDIGETLEADVSVDPSRSGIERFERWLLPAVPDEAPIHESDTLAGAEVEGEGTDVHAPTELQRSGKDASGSAGAGRAGGTGSQPPQPSDGHTELAATEDWPDRAEGAEQGRRAARPSPRQTENVDDSVDSSGWRGPLAIAAGIGALALAGSLTYAAVANWTGGANSESEGGSGERAAANAPADGGSRDGAVVDRTKLAPIDGPLNAYAGRCVVVGSSDTDFHTVYFFPEVGEIVLRGSSRLSWSKLELPGRKEDRIYFGYGDEGADGEEPEDRPNVRGSVRKSADKRIFEFDDGGTFVCRRESYGAYYTDLDFEGRWEARDGDRVLEFPSAGQRFTVENSESETDAGSARAEFEYRLLDGTPGASELELAVRRRDGDDWQPWSLHRKEDGDVLEIARSPGTDSETTRDYERPDEQRRAAAGSSGSSSGGSRSARGSRGSSGSGSGGAATSGSGSGSRGGSATGSGGDDGSSKMKPAWKNRFESILDKCRSAYQTIQDNNERYQKLVEAGKTEEAEAFQKEMTKKNRQASQQMQQASREFSTLMQEMNRGGVGSVRIREMSRKFSEACRGNN